MSTAVAAAALIPLGLPAIATAEAAPQPSPAPAPTTAQAAAPALVPGTPCTATAHACVSLSKNRAWLIRDGQVYYGEASALGGRANTPTPTGTFHVSWKDIDHRSSEFNNAPMPYSVFFTDTGVAFHQGSLTDRSAGCVHLSQKSARVFYEKLQVGDEVQVVP